MTIDQILLLILVLAVGIGVIILAIGIFQYFKTAKEIRIPKVEVSQTRKIIAACTWFIAGSLPMYRWYWEEVNQYTLMTGILFWIVAAYSLFDLIPNRKK